MHTIAPMRMLVVDDSDDTAMAMALLLKQYGHEAMIAEHGQEALQKAPAFHPDIMFIDLAMPEMDGLTLAQRLRQSTEFAATPMIAVTGYADEAHRAQAKAAGFDDFLAKPYSLVDLAAAIKRGSRTMLQAPGGFVLMVYGYERRSSRVPQATCRTGHSFRPFGHSGAVKISPKPLSSRFARTSAVDCGVTRGSQAD